MVTIWEHRIIIYVPRNTGDDTDVRNAIAALIASNGGDVDELAMFDKAIRTTPRGQSPNHGGYILSTAMTAPMFSALQSYVTTFNSGVTPPNRIHWYQVGVLGGNAGELIATTRSSATGQIGSLFRLLDAMDDQNVDEYFD